MPLHLTKVAVGCASIEALKNRVARRITAAGEVRVTTRMRPRRTDELVGGSLYWIVKHRIVARQQIICGCHVHVGIDDPDLAVATMNRTRTWLSVLLALSANSPFWQGVDTGYASYRLQVWQRWPTSGMPPRLGSDAEFRDLVDKLVAIEAIEDPTFLYWYVRPSIRYPTLEFRACDVCLSVDETVAIAGLTRALAWTCMREVLDDVPERDSHPEVTEASMWRAGRYGLSGRLVSPAAMVTRPASEAVGELLSYLRDGLEFHGDWVEVSNLVASTLASGDAARRQRAAFARHQDPHDVISYVMDATLASVGDPVASPATVW